MNIKRKKEIMLIMKNVVKDSKGSFTIQELKEKIYKNLNCRNFNNDSENIEEVNSFIKKMKNNKRLFKYNDDDERYFYVH